MCEWPPRQHAFLVADKVTVISKHNDDDQYIWESAAGGSFSVVKDVDFPHGEIMRGTKVICHLKEDQMEFLEERHVKDLVKKHSEFIGFPIELYIEKTKETQVTDSEGDSDSDSEDAEEKKDGEDDDEAKIEEVTEEDEEKDEEKEGGEKEEKRDGIEGERGE